MVEFLNIGKNVNTRKYNPQCGALNESLEKKYINYEKS